MSFLSARKSLILAFVISVAAGFATPSLAQQQTQQAPPDKSGTSRQGASAQGAPAQAAPAPPKLNPMEETDYKALKAVPDGDASTADKKIEMCQQFLQKYPDSRYQ